MIGINRIYASHSGAEAMHRLVNILDLVLQSLPDLKHFLTSYFLLNCSTTGILVDNQLNPLLIDFSSLRTQ